MGISCQFAANVARRIRVAIVLILLHLVVAPCAMAMTPAPAEAGCEHCLAISGGDACNFTAPTSGSLLGDASFGTGKAAPRTTGQPLRWLTPAARPGSTQAARLQPSWPRAQSNRHCSDPPLFLVLGRLRN
jgi:hypothetical protein